MKLISILALVACSSVAQAQWKYPPTKTVAATETYFGKTFQDPYRWLENLQDEAVQLWFSQQAQATDALLDQIPARDALVAEWMRLAALEPTRYTAITYEHGRVFYKKTLGSENVGKLYVRQGWRGAEKLLFDPSRHSPTGARPGQVTTLRDFVPAPDGRHVALALSAAGGGFSELRILDVATGRLLPERIYPSYEAMGWTTDSKSLFYDAGKTTDIKSLDIEQHRKTRLHALGTAIAADVDVLSDESHPELAIDAKEFPTAYVDESYPSYALGYLRTVQNERHVLYAPTATLARTGRLAWKVLATQRDRLVQPLELYKGHAYAVTYAGAARYKVVRTPLEHPDWTHAETVIAEAKDSIEAIVKSKSLLFVVYSNGVTGRLVRYDLEGGKAEDVALPGSGTVSLSCPDVHSNRCIVTTSGWTSPPTLYDYDGDQKTIAKSIFNTEDAFLLWQTGHPEFQPGARPATPSAKPRYEVYALQFAALKDVPVSALVAGADPARKVETAFMLWLVRGNGRNVLVDAGFHRQKLIDDWHPVRYVLPSEVLGRLGLQPADITDIVITHLHWDHAGGVDLFPRARVWIQKNELQHYADEAEARPDNAGVLAEDVLALLAREQAGKLTRVDGDAREILPGITVYTGGKHTFESQFVGVQTAAGAVVLASDNVYLYENLDRQLPITATLDAASNLRAQERMKQLAGAPRLVIPGHDAQVMTRFPNPVPGVARIQ